MASTTLGMGSVSHIPEMRPPIPCRMRGSVMTAVPQPSAAITAASMVFCLRAWLSISDTPNEITSSISVTLSSVHIPNDEILYSMFSLTVSVLSSSIPLYFLKRGQCFTLGSETSTTLPSSMTTRLMPRHSMTCLDTFNPHSMTSMLWMTTSWRGLSFLSVSTRPILSTTSIPSRTVPNTGCA